MRYIIVVVLCCFLSCKTGSQEAKTPEESTPVMLIEELQGKWQNTTDDQQFISISKDVFIAFSHGEQLGKPIRFDLRDTCPYKQYDIFVSDEELQYLVGMNKQSCTALEVVKRDTLLVYFIDSLHNPFTYHKL